MDSMLKRPPAVAPQSEIRHRAAKDSLALASMGSCGATRACRWACSPASARPLDLSPAGDPGAHRKAKNGNGAVADAIDGRLA